MKTKNVLIAIPPGKVQEGMQVLLAALPNVRIMVTGDGEAALQALRMHPFDLVILDWALPESEDLLGALRQGPARSLAMADRFGDVAPLLEAGVDEVRFKGHPANRLLTLIKNMLEDQDHE